MGGWREMATLLCIGLVLLQGGPVGGASRAGLRSGRSSSGSSSSASRSGSVQRTYRTAGGYSGMSSRRYNYYRASSYYLSYVPGVRSTRGYTLALMGGLYWSYYTRYHYYSGTPAYASRHRPAENTTLSVCANYAEGDNGTYLGIFVCPLDFEPTTFTACCGDDYEEFCCEPENNTPMLVIFSVVVVLAVILASIVRYKYPGKWKRRAGRVISHVGPDTTQAPQAPQPTQLPHPPQPPHPPQQSAHPSAPFSGQYMTPPANKYPPQHTQSLPSGVAEQNALPPGYSENNYTTVSSFQTVYSIPATAPPPYEAAAGAGFSDPVYGPTAPTKY